MATVEQSEATLVTLTEGAAEKVRALMDAEPAGEAEVLRVAIQGGGCSGFEYALGFDRGAQAGDHELSFHGVTVVVDPFSAPYLQGSTIDFLAGLQESGFKIENPNAVSACGCGSSFQVAEGDEAPEDGTVEGNAAGCGSGCGHAH
jgi:iron-sulfur cluster assembly protein